MSAGAGRPTDGRDEQRDAQQRDAQVDQSISHTPGHAPENYAKHMGWYGLPSSVPGLAAFAVFVAIVATVACFALGSIVPIVVGMLAVGWQGLWLWVAMRAGRVKPGTCARCGYDLTGLKTGQACPECGRTV